MKREVWFFFISIAIAALILLVGNNTVDVKAQDRTAKKAEETQPEGLVWDWMNDFENCEDWRALSTSPLGDTKIRKIDGKPVAMENGKAVPILKATDLEEKDKNLVHESKYVLGVKTYFIDRGFDRVEVFPPNEYIIRGKAKEVRVWALGRKFRHTLFIKLRDFRGNIHKLKIGRLDFWGWQELKMVVPGWLPQSTRYALLDRNLHFVSFFVECDHYEVPGTFYFYLDNFRIRTDLSEFTGDVSIKDNW
jgi:hypothetical protein